MTLQNQHIVLRPATLADRHAVYEWLACSDLTSSMAGPPHFAEVQVQTWEDFCDDYLPYFFDGSEPTAGRAFIIEAPSGEAVGCVSYSRMDEFSGKAAELDIWMRDSTCCGQGWGSEALGILARKMYEMLGVPELFLRPSARNTRAVRAYEKAGFVKLNLTQNEQALRYGPGEYHDTVTMQRLFD